MNDGHLEYTDVLDFFLKDILVQVLARDWRRVMKKTSFNTQLYFATNINFFCIVKRLRKS